jgi:hypothetical protein
VDGDVVVPPVAEDGLEDVLDDLFLEVGLLLVPVGCVLGGEDDGVDAGGLAVVAVLDGDLALGVGAEALDAAGLADLACFSTRRWLSWMGRGISSGVSVQAKPNIMPWSPAPSSPLLPSSTPMAMSADWALIELSTAQDTWSKAMSPEV